MKNVFSLIWKIIAVALICVGVYLLIQVMGEAEHVIEAYEQLTGNSIGATNSIKIVFLRDYINHTGNTDILVTLNITPAEAELILRDGDFTGATPNDETQKPGSDSNNGEGNGDSGNNSDDSSSNSSGDGNNSGTTSGSKPGFMKQSDSVIAQIKGSSGTISKLGCAIVGLYNTYYANTNNPISLKDMLLRYSREKLGGSVKEDSNGNLQGKIGSLAEGGALWNWMVSNYFNPGGYMYNADNGSVTVNSKIQSDGKYLIYYDHCDNKICVDDNNNVHTDGHWVYAVKHGNNWTVENPNDNKEGQNIGGKPLIRYFKIS